MMHCKLFSFTAFAFVDLHCCFQLLFLQVTLCASINGDANSTASCSSAFMECANSGNITYPFWGSTSCAASPSYVLHNCTSSSTAAYWDAFATAANGVIGPPSVVAVEWTTGLSDQYYGQVEGTSIQLSWNRTLIDLGFCAPLFSSKNLSLYNIPSSINLTGFPDGSALRFSSNNSFLLFNCTHNASDVVAQLGFQNLQAESASGCMPYKGLCTSLAKTPCIEWSLPLYMKELMVQHVLDSLSCSHFMFGVSSLYKWSIGSIELTWTDMQCEKCQNLSGTCSFDSTFPVKFNQCMWPTDVCFGGPLRCNTGAKIGFGVAFVVAVLGILIVIRFKYDFGNLFGMIRESIRVGFHSLTKVTIPIAIDGLTERPMEYSYNAIASATKSFSSLVGEGGFAKVYKGTVTQANSHGGSELQIAVKVLEVRSKHSKKQFMNEVVTIGRIHHVNVVRLLGFCMQEDHEMLLYEYVVNGSLDRWLFVEKAKAREQMLDWGQRYAIALGVARGLSYLHEECRHRTVHCDIKPQNILLDGDMHPKIADFGLARLMGRDESKVVTLAKGTPGYMAPEFWMGGESQLSTKIDVYSYGMVLLELISGRRNFSRDATVSGSSFPAMAFRAAMDGELKAILDSRVSITSDADEAEKAQAQWNQVKTAVFVALWCIQDQPGRRPSMSEVVKYLEGGAAVPECPPQPNISIFSVSIMAIPPESSSSNYQNDCTPLSVGR